jgi:hypothetical protein
VGNQLFAQHSFGDDYLGEWPFRSAWIIKSRINSLPLSIPSRLPVRRTARPVSGAWACSTLKMSRRDDRFLERGCPIRGNVSS